MAKSRQSRRSFASIEDYARAGRVSGRTLARIKELSRETEVIDRLVLERVRAGLTQTELARRLGTSQSYVSKLEDSLDDDLTLGEIDRYCAALGIKAGLSLKA
jgi:DNA-binding Xre family transcriptional regulator